MAGDFHAQRPKFRRHRQTDHIPMVEEILVSLKSLMRSTGRHNTTVNGLWVDGRGRRKEKVGKGGGLAGFLPPPFPWEVQSAQAG